MADIDSRLVADIELRTTNLERSMRRAQRVTGAGFKQIERDGTTAASRLDKAFTGIGAGLRTSMLAVGGAAGIGGLGIAGIFAGAKTAAADLANIAAEAKRAGLGVEAFQELGYAAAQSRVGIDALVDGIKELQLRGDEFIVTGAGSGAEAFQRLGYTAVELKAKLADPAALFEEIIDKLATLDKASQIRIADEIFGGTGGEQFVRLLDQSVGSIGRMRREARETGNVLSSEVIANVVELDRQFNNVATTVGITLKGAIVAAAAGLKTFVDLLRDTENQSTSTLQSRIDGITAAVENARKSTLAFYAIGGDEGIKQRLAERDQLQSQLSGRTTITVTPAASGGQGDLSKVVTPASKAVDDLKKAYAGLMASAQQRITQLNTETATVGMAAREAERFRFEQEMLAEAQRAGITLTDQQRSAIGSLASGYADASIAAQTAATSFQNAADAKAEFADMGLQATKDFLGDLRTGATLTDALSSAFSRLADRLLDVGLDMVLGPLFKSLGGSVASLLGFKAGGEVPGYAEGGKVHGTGTGTSDSILAKVSNGEFIVNADATSHNRDLLEAINAGKLPAFADGGIVRAPAFSAPASRAASAAAPITFHNTFEINASGGTPAQNDDMAKRIGAQVEDRMRAVVTSELLQQMRPGNLLNS